MRVYKMVKMSLKTSQPQRLTFHISNNPLYHNRKVSVLDIPNIWPELCYDLQKYVIYCLQCQLNKVKWLKVASLFHPLDIPNNQWDNISLAYLEHKEVMSLYGLLSINYKNLQDLYQLKP